MLSSGCRSVRIPRWTDNQLNFSTIFTPTFGILINILTFFEYVERIHKIDGPFEKNEEWLQKYLAAKPDLLPLRDLEGVPTRLRLIARELLGIDLLFADDQGLLTIVETKLAENPEAKREVVAQLLDYASQLSKFDTLGLCELIAKLKGKDAIRGLGELQNLVEALSKQIGETNRGEKREQTVGEILANYVLKGKVIRQETKEVKSFLKKLDSLLRDGSFRLVVVTYEASPQLLDLLNYVNSTLKRGLQLVAVELSFVDPADGKFVPHLVGAPNLLSPEYYRKEAVRINKEWDKDEFLNKLPEDLREDVSTLLSKIDDRNDRLFYEFGTGGKTGSVNMGVKIPSKQRRNTLLSIRTDGTSILYFSSAQTKLTQIQKEELVKEISRYEWLREAHGKIVAGMKTRKNSEPNFELKDCGTKGERWKPLLQLLEGFYRIANSQLESQTAETTKATS
jgi:hypothetical protein